MMLFKVIWMAFIGLLFLLFAFGLGYALAEFLTALDPFYH